MNKKDFFEHELAKKLIIGDVAEVISFCAPIIDIQPYYDIYLEKFGDDITIELFEEYFNECLQSKAFLGFDLVEIKIKDNYYIMLWVTRDGNSFILNAKAHEAIIKVIRNHIDPEYDPFEGEK